MNMRIFKRTLAVILSACCAFSFSACGSTGANNNANLRKVSFMLFWAPDTNHIGIYVAKHKGWFKDAGLDVNILSLIHI